MRRVLRICVVFAAASALAPAALASAPAAKTISTGGSVAGISAEVNRVAVHTRTTGDPTCDAGLVWTPASDQVVHLGEAFCTGADQPATSYGQITLAGNSVAWSRNDGAGASRCNGVYAVKLSRPTMTRALYYCGGSATESVSVSGHGDILLIAYTDGQTLELDRVTSAKRKLILTLPGSQSLAGADAGRFLVAASNTRLAVYSSAGAPVATIPVAPGAHAAISGTDVVVRNGSTLSVYDAATGAKRIVRTMAPRGTWQDMDGSFVAYSKAGAIHLVNLTNGRDRVVASVEGLVDADLERSGLYYAWNDPTGGANPGRVTFVPTGAFPK